MRVRHFDYAPLTGKTEINFQNRQDRRHHISFSILTQSYFSYFGCLTPNKSIDIKYLEWEYSKDGVDEFGMIFVVRFDIKRKRLYVRGQTLRL